MNHGKISRTPMTKVERVLKRMEKQEKTAQRLKELLEEPPSRLDQLLKATGREPTFEERQKENGKLALRARERLLEALRVMQKNEKKRRIKGGQ